MSGGATATISTPARARRRWSIAEFDRMVAGGLIREGDGTHLWDGEILGPMAENQPRVNAVANLQQVLLSRLPAADWTVNQGHPLELAPGFLPQPDIAVLRGPRSLYRRRRPIPADVALLIEVADSTYADDAGPYLRAYAMAGIPRYWIVNVQARRIEAFDAPEVLRYGRLRDFNLGEMAALILDDVEYGAVGVVEVLRDSLDPPDEGP